ncbi:MBL fold metallo-hydrolase [candidate division KSB1 bacterium]|nr:MBL fold metallo-hydrolase [candidate division KSB1 bacterium]
MILETRVIGPLGTNCYFFGCSETGEVMVIDPADEADDLLAYLQQSNYSLRYIFLTHTHFDHVGAVAALHKDTAAPIMAHRQERMIAKSIPLQAALFGFPRPEAFKITDWLTDQQTLSIGTLEGKVLHTPGHSPGGVCFLANSHLFSGDTLFRESIGRTDLPRGSHSKLVQSVRTKLWPLPDETTVHPGHGPATTIAHEKRHNPYLKV